MEVDGPEIPEGAEFPEGGDFQMPSMDELLKALEGMEGLSEDDKNKLKESLIFRSQQAQGMDPSLAAAPIESIAPDFLILFVFITVIALIFAFFGYKLYKSLIERERRREEKRRQKQQKKRK